MLTGDKASFGIIEQDADAVLRARELGYLAVQWSATIDDFLVQARIAHAGHVVATVEWFAETALITMESLELNPEVGVIARVEREADVRRLKRAAARRVLRPSNNGGRGTVQIITKPGVADFIAEASLGGGYVALAEI
jgi:Trk K+ transport system NAD-binding subunit